MLEHIWLKLAVPIFLDFLLLCNAPLSGQIYASSVTGSGRLMQDKQTHYTDAGYTHLELKMIILLIYTCANCWQFCST